MIYDPIRRRSVTATPEEIVRQKLLHMMLDCLGYPKGLIAVEKEIGNARRRVDVICYAIHSTDLSPLLLIECKAHDCTVEAREQAFGYNASLQAPFLCIAGKTQIHTLWLNNNKIVSVPFLPPYRDLLEMSVHANVEKQRGSSKDDRDPQKWPYPAIP